LYAIAGQNLCKKRGKQASSHSEKNINDYKLKKYVNEKEFFTFGDGFMFLWLYKQSGGTNLEY
jgi:hypothetical protein